MTKNIKIRRVFKAEIEFKNGKVIPINNKLQYKLICLLQKEKLNINQTTVRKIKDLDDNAIKHLLKTEHIRKILFQKYEKTSKNNVISKVK